MRTFSHKVYDTGGTTPAQNVINHMNARTATQNKLSTGGAPTQPQTQTVPQFRTSGPPAGPDGTNSTITRMASAHLNMDNSLKLQSTTGKPIGGRKSRKLKRKLSKKRRKSRKNI
jgi:hypothetical protein